ncbi:hypothetical protein [Sinorhizobium meliloti]|uniref:hypothetical protein n=1 Tax=Rhizobium meliloti TaxID=382 RepID=UPI000FDC67F1|nr:hypothetical protein [Sinorhizobium meliloti]RVK42978.1 hypothetical protein CN163_00015 [Sinorhizobium meliloti]
MPKVDTVGDKFYKPLETVEAVGGWLFWLVAVLSIATLLVDKAAHSTPSDYLQIAFIVSVFLFFVQGLAHKLYLFPRAEDERRRELLSNSFNVTLTHEATVEYYNNDQTNPLKRLAASVMESSFFTKEILRKMLRTERATTLGYAAVYFAALSNRSTDLGVASVVAQLVFSEDILMRWLRMEWLRMRSEQVFANMTSFFNAKHSFAKPLGQSEALDHFSFYETAKSTAGILLSSKLFHKHNSELTSEWEKVRGRHGL